MYNYQQQCLHKPMRKVKTFCKSRRKADTKEVRLPARTGQQLKTHHRQRMTLKKHTGGNFTELGTKIILKSMSQQFKKFLFKFLNFKLLSRRHFLIYKLANKVQA